MDDKAIVETITDAARVAFRRPDLILTRGTVFQDIDGFDSVLAIQFILSLEAMFAVTFSDAEVDRMMTAGDLIDMLRAKRVMAAA